MNFVNQLLKDHSRSNVETIVNAIGTDSEKLASLITIIYNKQPPLPQRASWVLPILNNQHPELLKTYIPKFINTITQFKVNAVKRNIMKVLAESEIPEKLNGKLINVCYRLLLDSNETVAVKVHAMQAIANITERHHELKSELKTVIKVLLPQNTAAFSARAKHIFKKLEL